MLSSRGISWRHGPHQLAQKLIMTTWPWYCVRLTSLPSREARLNCGAGAPVVPASAGTASASAAATATKWLLMCVSPSEEDGRSDARLDVVGELVGAEQVGLEGPVLHR